MDRIVVAIDGHAQAGKGTLARKLAKHFQLLHVDSGLLYRAVALYALDEGLNIEDGEEVAFGIPLMHNGMLGDYRLGSEETSRITAQISKLPEVREAVNRLQRSMVARHPRGAVVEGRDICTLIFPDAPFKFFLTASSQVRAARRLAALGPSTSVTLEELQRDIEDRDHVDSTRGIAPLVLHPKAHLLDSTSLSIEEVFQAALAFIGDGIPTN